MEYRKYCAFISYRHYTPDMEIAQRLHTLIEQYTVPVDFRKDPSQKHPGQVFRDQEELPLSADLGKDIETALDNSDWLICVCSPRYLESRWCMRELEYFIERHGRERVLTLLVEGDPDKSFPETLLHYTDKAGNTVDLEPLAADVRSDSLSGSLKRLKKEKLRILAPMLGTTFDGLYRRARRRTRRNILAVAAAVAVAGASIAAYTAEQNRRVENQRAAAARNEVDMLLERVSTEKAKLQNNAALDTALQALDLSGSLDGYRELNIQSALEELCYNGDFALRTQTASSTHYFIANSIFFTMEYFSPDGSKVLCSPGGYELDCCDTATGNILWSLDSDAYLTSARWKRDGSRVVVTSYTGHAVWLINAETGEVIKKIGISFVSNAAWFSEDLNGEAIMITCQDGFLCWHTDTDPDAQKMAWFMKEVAGQLCSGRVFHNRFIAMHNYERFGVIDLLQDKGYTYVSPMPHVNISNYAVSPDGRKLFVHQHKTMFVSDLETDEVLWTTEYEKPDQYPDSIPDSYGPSAVWAGNYIFNNCRFSGSAIDYTGVVLNAETGEILYTLDDVFCIGATEDGENFICSDGVYRASDGEYVMTCGTRTMKTFGQNGGTYEISGGLVCAADPSGKYWFTGSTIINAPGTGSQYRVEKYEGTLYADRNDARTWVTPDGQYQVIPEINSPGFTVLRNDETNWQYIVRTFTPENWIVFSPDSRLTALGTTACDISVYELETGEQLFTSTDWAFQRSFGGFTFNQDGTLLMYTSALKDWFCVASMKTGKILYEIHETRPAVDWGFDSETGDAVILFEDGSARCADIFTSPEELYAYARALQKSLSE